MIGGPMSRIQELIVFILLMNKEVKVHFIKDAELVR